jgi:hypothetical protein
MRGGSSRKTVKQACAPSRKQRPVKGSCYTSETLVDLKNAYNRQSNTPHITTGDPNIIVAELDNKLRNKCSKESCWVDALHINNAQHIKNTQFAPKRPASWTKNPREWLSNHDIDAAMEQYVAAYPDFMNVPASAIDYDYRMPNGQCVARALCQFSLADCIAKKINKIGVIFNLDKHNLGGSHWVALFIDIAHKYIFFFDSAGANIPRDTRRFIAEVERQGKSLSSPIKFTVRSNYPVTHQHGDTECGMYALFFISTLVSNTFSLKQVARLFAGKRRFSDKELEAKRSEMFNATI